MGMDSSFSVKKLLGNDARGDLSSCKLLGLTKKKCTSLRVKKRKAKKVLRKRRVRKVTKALVKRRLQRKALKGK